MAESLEAFPEDLPTGLTRAEFVNHSVLQACGPILTCSVAYWTPLIVYIALAAPTNYRLALVLQKLAFLGLFIELRRRVLGHKIPLRMAHMVVTAILATCLSSALLSNAGGFSSAITIHVLVLIVGVGMIDLDFRWASFHWLLCWLSWTGCQIYNPSAQPIGMQFFGLLGIQLLALAAVSVRRQTSWKLHELVRRAEAQEERLRTALLESEKSRADLDARVEVRTSELRATYEELRISVQEREKIAEERARLQEQLTQSQKMESLGLLAGGVAHDFNNLLTVILGNLDLARPEVPPHSMLEELLIESEMAAKRAADVTDQLLSFSRKQVMRIEAIELGRLVEDSTKLMQRLLGEDIALTVERHDQPVVVQGDRSQLRQVLLNLVINARDAMPSGGRLSISTRRDADRATLEVRDTGHGIEPSALPRIFEPFFTTKGIGKGTGLGLSTVHGVVSQHGGTIEVETQVGLGTTFRIHLPEVGPLDHDSGSRRHMPCLNGSGKILLVEDDAQVRHLAARVLHLSGYTVTEAESAEQALNYVVKTDTVFDLLVTDVVMPGMDGATLATVLRESHPNLPVLFMSGYTDDRLSHFGIDRGECNFIAKPFAPAQFTMCVGQALESVRDNHQP